MQENRCIFVSIPLNLSMVRRVDSVGLCTLCDMEGSYTKLSCDIPWNIPLATCIFLAYSAHEPLGEYEYEENTSDSWDLFHGAPLSRKHNGINNQITRSNCKTNRLFNVEQNCLLAFFLKLHQC